MEKDERYQGIITWFSENMPVAETELIYKTPYELLVAVMLSAQCTDKRVNMTTPHLFAKYPDALSLSKASEGEVFALIKSISYPNSKTKHLIGMAKMLIERFNGNVPDDMEALQTLPGVGRKTANVMMIVAFDHPAMPVDTHVFRVAHRIGLVSESATTPLETERQLTASFPQKLLSIAHHWLILHGRYICLARKPKCNECGIQKYCNYYATTVDS